mgnify:CR=1 FL=1
MNKDLEFEKSLKYGFIRKVYAILFLMILITTGISFLPFYSVKVQVFMQKTLPFLYTMIAVAAVI